MKKAKSILALLMAFVMLMSFGVSGYAVETASEKEPNNSIETATAFGFGTEIKGDLEVAGDEDYYSFSSKTSGLASVTLKHGDIADKSDYPYFIVTVYNSAGRAIDEFKSTAADKSVKSEAFQIEADAVYYVKVTAGTVYSGSVPYVLFAEFDKSALTEKEPNDTPSAGTPLELSVSGSAKRYYGTISKEGTDVDFYKIKPATKGVIYVYLYNGSTPADFKASLYAFDDGREAALIDVPISEIKIDSNTQSVQSVGIGVDATEYMVKIEGLNGTTGGYSTRVFFQPATVAETEYNNSYIYADSVKVGGSVQGTTSHIYDIDWFQFEAEGNNAGHTITIGSLNNKSTNEGSWLVTLYEMVNKELVPIEGAEGIQVRAGAPMQIKTAKDELVAGKIYYLSIQKSATYNDEIYQISIATIKSTEDEKPSEGVGFFEQIKIYFEQFMKNFEGWFEEINVMAIVSSITASVIKVLTILISSMG